MSQSLSEYCAEIDRLSGQVEKSLRHLFDKVQEYAEADNEYRKAKATAYLSASGTVQERQAHVDKACEQERFRAHRAEAYWRASQIAVKARLAQLSAAQSKVNALRQEMKFEQTRPDPGVG